MGTNIIQIVIADKMEIWWERNFMVFRRMRWYKLRIARIGECKGRKTPKGGVFIVDLIGYQLDPIRSSSV